MSECYLCEHCIYARKEKQREKSTSAALYRAEKQKQQKREKVD